ncbi:DUF6270 domain-containing protein [Brevibacterium litoralis]|uniref:DUF6270 domain-containing protein n=1 Tax=Brevibacterium litoralis TaxID=3138935 RepID=UPI0032EC0803
MEQLPVAIYGSCVSRDLCEFWPEARVARYVARQSAIVRLEPVGRGRYTSDDFESRFQARMYSGDRMANAGKQILDSKAAVLLVDLVDERRGVWRFPDGTYLTNSVEAFRIGVEQWAPAHGGRLIPFGTDEHFYLWREGFERTMRRNRALAKPRMEIVLLDLDWAEALDGQGLGRGVVSWGGSVLRQTQRQTGRFRRALSMGKSPVTAVSEMLERVPSVVEEFARESRRMNALVRRYIDVAAPYADLVVRRMVDQVRMSEEHKWGLEPYHYRDSDYEGVVEQIRDHLASEAQDG